MSILITVIIFGIIVIIHEFGHFLAAKACGVAVLEFAAGMGGMLCSKKIGNTVYSLRILPIGGFCRMKGEESSTEPDSFAAASIIERIIIILAGPFMNFLLAFALFSVIIMNVGVSTAEISDIIDGYPAQQAGIEAGDKIIKINNTKIHSGDDISYYLSRNTKASVDLTIKRSNGEKYETSLIPVNESGRLITGVYLKNKSPFFHLSVDGFERAGFLESLRSGYWRMWFMVKVSMNGIIEFFTLKVGLDKVAGPIGLTTVIDDAYEQTIQTGLRTMLLSMINITALLSANLGIMNLLPIPALDGGRFIFLLAELLRGKPVNPEKEGFIHFVGFALIMMFGLFIAFHDIFRIMG